MNARRLVAISFVIIVVVITALLVIGYTQPLSRIRVEVYNASGIGASIVVFVDNATNGEIYEIPSLALMELGIWPVHAGTHNVAIVSDDFLNMVYNTRELSTTVHAGSYETVTAFWGLALI